MKNQKLISRNVIRKFKPGGDTRSLQEEFPIERGINGEYYIVHTPESNHAIFSDIISNTQKQGQNNASLSPWSSNINTNTPLSPWSKTKNSNVKLSPWSTNQNNQQTQRSINNNQSTTRSNSNRNQQISTSSNRTNTNVEPWGMDLIFTSPLQRILQSTNSQSQQQTTQQQSSNHRPFFEEYPYYTEQEVQQNQTVNNKQKSKKKTSQTTTISEQQTPETKQYSELERAVGMKGFLNLLANGYDLATAGAIINGSSPSQLLELYDKTSNLFTKPKEEVKPKEEKKEQEVTTPVRTIPYNRADIRSLIRNGGYNPYSDYSAGQRKALRKYLNKEDNQQYEDWMAPFVVFKKIGGKIISKNPIQRFKNI